MIHWAIQGYVAEMPRASLHTCLARIASLILVCDTHTGIVDCVEIGLKSGLVVDLRGPDLSYRHLTHVIWREKTELKSFDAFICDCERLGTRRLLRASEFWHVI